MDNQKSKGIINTIIAQNYKILKKIGSGAFGDIYLVQNLQNNNEYAIKLEKSNQKNSQLLFEAKLYAQLQGSDKSDKGIPRIYAQGTEGKYNYLVMDCLGKSLEDIFVSLDKKMSLKSVLMLAEQMIQRLEFIHSRSYIHRDMKPDNFLMGRNEKAHRVYIVDFGLSKKYTTKEGHIPYKDGKSLIGTARYASINTHKGSEQSRRDDLESLGYVLLYLLKGQLPWQNMKAKNQKEKYKKIMEKKIQISSEVLCQGFPDELAQYLNYCKNLKFEDRPDYQYLRRLIHKAMKNNGIETDNVYDWNKQKDQKDQKDQMEQQQENDQQQQQANENNQKEAPKQVDKIQVEQVQKQTKKVEEVPVKKVVKTNGVVKQQVIETKPIQQLKDVKRNTKISLNNQVTASSKKLSTVSPLRQSQSQQPKVDYRKIQSPLDKSVGQNNKQSATTRSRKITIQSMQQSKVENMKKSLKNQ